MIELGCSPRASLDLFKGVKAIAYINERTFVRPDDVIYLAPYILSHRIILKGLSKYKKLDSSSIIREIVDSIPIPLEDIK